MSDILEAQKDYKKLKSQAAKEKLEALERSLGISASQAAATLQDMDEEEFPAENGPSGSGSRSPTEGGDKTAIERKAAPKAKDLTKEDLAQLAGRKHKFDDSEFLEQSREINESVRGAVAAGAASFPLHAAKQSALTIDSDLLPLLRTPQEAQKGQDSGRRFRVFGLDGASLGRCLRASIVLPFTGPGTGVYPAVVSYRTFLSCWAHPRAYEPRSSFRSKRIPSLLRFACPASPNARLLSLLCFP